MGVLNRARRFSRLLFGTTIFLTIVAIRILLGMSLYRSWLATLLTIPLSYLLLDNFWEMIEENKAMKQAFLLEATASTLQWILKATRCCTLSRLKERNHRSSPRRLESRIALARRSLSSNLKRLIQIVRSVVLRRSGFQQDNWTILIDLHNGSVYRTNRYGEWGEEREIRMLSPGSQETGKRTKSYSGIGSLEPRLSTMEWDDAVVLSKIFNILREESGIIGVIFRRKAY